MIKHSTIKSLVETVYKNQDKTPLSREDRQMIQAIRELLHTYYVINCDKSEWNGAMIIGKYMINSNGKGQAIVFPDRRS